MKRIDLTGEVYGDLTVLEYAGDRKWKCRCSCGVELNVNGNSLRRGTAHSCGHDNPKAFKDITGQKFGEWIVLEYAGSGYWKCQCSCGNIKNVAGWHLRKGITTSCGHGKTGFANKDFKENKEISTDTIDIEVGKTIGEWEILERIDSTYYKCRCSCGNIRKVSAWNLKTGRSKSCGECKFDNLTGQVFNEWTVLEYVGNSYYKCRCSCGAIRNIRRNDLKLGKSKSCGGEQHSNREKLEGQRFGMLTVLEYEGNNYYKCKCDCGNIKTVLSANLKSGWTTSCGCKHKTPFSKEVLEAFSVDLMTKNNRKPTIADIANALGYDRGYISQVLNKYEVENVEIRSMVSSYEIEIAELIKSIKPDIEMCTSYRRIMGLDNKPIELDIYLPEYKLAIEVNGDYWHSSKLKDKNYHKNKTETCENMGIHLIHIFEYEWINENTKRKIKDYIKDLITQRNKVYARECNVINLTSEEYTIFNNKYHLQGSVNAQIRIGITYENELIAAMGFGKSRFSNEFEYELLRYCTKPGIDIIGGAERIFKNFIENNMVTSVVSYCDRGKFTGGVYARLGFQFNGNTEPGYIWVGAYGKTVNRYNSQKHILIQNGYGDLGNTEDEIMEALGYNKIYNSGNKRFIWRNMNIQI